MREKKLLLLLLLFVISAILSVYPQFLSLSFILSFLLSLTPDSDVHALIWSYICLLLYLISHSLFVFHVNLQDNKRYSFPFTLDMKEFCESSCEVKSSQDYELFSVVIHG